MTTVRVLDRGSLEYVAVTLTVSAAEVAVADVEVAITTGHPAEEDWTSTVAELDTDPLLVVGVLVGPAGTLELDPGRYTVRVRVTSSPEVPVLVAGQLTIT
jgi:hypothetical protein